MSYLYQEAEKFIKEIYWSETHDKENPLKLSQVIAEKLINDNKEKDPEYYDHREGVIHVSSLSKCLRGVVHEMLGAKKDAPPDARQLGVFKAGNLFEDFIADALGYKMLDRQTEYIFKYKNIYLTGRDDGTILHEGVRMMLEAKSVHSDSFWYREQEGTLVASHNQMQIQTYLWLRRKCDNVFKIESMDGDLNEIIYTNLSREEVIEYKGYFGKSISVTQIEKPDNSNLNGIFSYISKDDCTIIAAPVKYNPRIINETVLPALSLIMKGYDEKDASMVPAPDLAVFSDSKGQWQKNWLATYCDYHTKCCGLGWEKEATNLVVQRNREAKSVVFPHLIKKEKPQIEVAGQVEAPPEGVFTNKD